MITNVIWNDLIDFYDIFSIVILECGFRIYCSYVCIIQTLLT